MPKTGYRVRVGAALAIAAVPSTVLAVVTALPPTAIGSASTSGAVTTSPTSTPTDSPSQTPTDTTSPTATGQPTATPSVTPSQGASGSASPSPVPTAHTPTTDAPTIDPSASAPRPAALRAVLTADAGVSGSLVFDGIVVHDTAAGEVRTLRFVAEDITFDNLQLDVTLAGRTFRTASDGTTVLSASVVMDATLFRAQLSGDWVEFTPDNPPPSGPLPVAEFTDFEVHAVQVDAGQITISGYSQSFVT